jgi:hypothetical protein
MDDARQKELDEIPLIKTDRASWPKGVRPISIDEMDALGVDRDGLIYWNGHPVQVRRKIELRSKELVLAAVATVATLIQAIVALFPSLPKSIEAALGL